MKDTITKLEEAFTDYASGNADFSSRIRLPTGKGSYIAMPGSFNRYSIAGMKTYVSNRKGIRHVMVFNTKTAEPIALIEASRLGQLKTGGLPAMVTRRLLRRRPHKFSLIGSGLQAEAQLEGMISQFDLDDLTVFSRNYKHAEAFAERASRKFGIELKACETVSEALQDADVVNTITNAVEPIIHRKDLGEFYHVNLVGANIPGRVEAAPDVLSESQLVVVEHMEQAMKESTEIIELMNSSNHPRCIELKELMSDSTLSSPDRTVFKSMGVGLEDLAAAASLLQRMDIIS